MNLTRLNHQVWNNSSAALVHFQMSVFKREVAGLEIENENSGRSASRQSTDLLFPVQDTRRDGGRFQNYILEAHSEAKHLGHDLWQGDAERFRCRIPVEVGADRIRIKMMFV